MTWTPMSPSTTESGTGYEIPGIPLPQKSVACRFHLGGIKTFRNEDNAVVNQIGRIRVDLDSEMPNVGQLVIIQGHFKGVIKGIFRGQLSWRLDV